MSAPDPPPRAEPLKRDRLAQSRSALRQLRLELGWIETRQKNDTHQQYATQLAALRQRFDAMLGELERGLGGVSESGSLRQLYADCREIDVRLMWVRRVHDWYRAKFDQRDDSRFKHVLAAADEVVWSCYTQPFRTSKRTSAAVPLPFVESSYSPSAIPRVDPPQDLRSDVNADFLKRMLNELPVPVVGLPPTCADEPWWLAFLAHEVGHHVQFDLVPESGLTQTFPRLLDAAGGARWTAWHEEVFADLYSFLMIGPWAAWALAELVWGADRAMLDDSNRRYPAPLIRLMFMAELAGGLRIDPAPALRGLAPSDLLVGPPVAIRTYNARETVGEDAESVEAVAAAALATTTDFGPLAALCEFDADEFKGPKPDVVLWSQALRGLAHMKIRQDLRGARMVLAGSVHAWAAIAEIADDDDRAKKREALKEQTLSKIVASREEVTRAAEPRAEPETDASTRRLVDLLMREAPMGPGQ